MADNVDILLRVRGARKAAADVKGVSRETDRLGRTTGRAAAQTDRMGKSSGRSGKALRGIGKGAAYALGAGGFGGGMYALFDITRKSVGEFRESQKVSRQTAATLKSTGGAANISAKGIGSLATGISKKTGIDDEAIQASENLLLTFTKVRNETGHGNKIFNQATSAVTDMSVALKQDGKSSAIQLGKALNNPIKGVTALQRVGVAFTDQQKDQIKTMVESGDTLGAQKMILKEVNSEFGGSAKAQNTAGKQLQVSLGNLAETIGSKIAPSLNTGAQKANKFVNEMQSGTGQGGRFVTTLKGVWTQAKPIVTWVGRAAVNVGKFAGQHPKVTKLALAITAAGIAVNAVRTSRAYSGVKTLIGGLGRLSRTTAGQKMKESLFNGLRNLAGGIRTRLSGTRRTAVTSMASVGGSAGRAGGTAAATSFSSRASTGIAGSAKGGRLKGLTRPGGAFSSLGTSVGIAMAIPIAFEVGSALEDVIGDAVESVGGSRSAGKVAGKVGAAFLMPTVTGTKAAFGITKKLVGGGAKGGHVTSGGIRPYGTGGLVPRGEDTLAGLRFGEFVMQKSAVDRMGLGAMRAMNSGVTPMPSGALAGAVGDIYVTAQFGEAPVETVAARQTDRKRSRR